MPADQMYWIVWAARPSKEEATIVAGCRPVLITALKMAERITQQHNMRLAREHGIDPVRFPEILQVVSWG